MVVDTITDVCHVFPAVRVLFPVPLQCFLEGAVGAEHVTGDLPLGVVAYFRRQHVYTGGRHNLSAAHTWKAV